MAALREKIEAVIAVAGIVAAGAATYVSMSASAIAEETVQPVEKRVLEVEKKQAAQEAILPRVEKALDEIKQDQRAQREATEAILRELARGRRRANGGG